MLKQKKSLRTNKKNVKKTLRNDKRIFFKHIGGASNADSAKANFDTAKNAAAEEAKKAANAAEEAKKAAAANADNKASLINAAANAADAAVTAADAAVTTAVALYNAADGTDDKAKANKTYAFAILASISVNDAKDAAHEADKKVKGEDDSLNGSLDYYTDYSSAISKAVVSIFYEDQQDLDERIIDLSERAIKIGKKINEDRNSCANNQEE